MNLGWGLRKWRANAGFDVALPDLTGGSECRPLIGWRQVQAVCVLLESQKHASEIFLNQDNCSSFCELEHDMRMHQRHPAIGRAPAAAEAGSWRRSHVLQAKQMKCVIGTFIQHHTRRKKQVKYVLRNCCHACCAINAHLRNPHDSPDWLERNRHASRATKLLRHICPKSVLVTSTRFCVISNKYPKANHICTASVKMLPLISRRHAAASVPSPWMQVCCR